MPQSKKNKPPTKAKAVEEVAAEAGCSKAEVRKVLDALVAVINRSLNKHGEFTIHGMIKVKKAAKKATKARVGRNPRTGEAIQISAKPATTVIRVRALKGLKDML
jgi:nucleoid DNA-binding protein